MRMVALLAFYAGAAFSVPACYVLGRNYGAEPVPWPLIAFTAAFWPVAWVVALSAVATGRSI